LRPSPAGRFPLITHVDAWSRAVAADGGNALRLDP